MGPYRYMVYIYILFLSLAVLPWIWTRRYYPITGTAVEPPGRPDVLPLHLRIPCSANYTDIVLLEHSLLTQPYETGQHSLYGDHMGSLLKY